MNRLSRFLLPSLFTGILLVGCQKSTNQTATSSTPTASENSQVAQNQAPAPAPVLPPAPPPPIVVPAATAISVVLDQTISSKSAAAGQGFSATVSAPIAVDGVVVIPKGTHANGVVNDAKAAGRFKGGASLDISLTRLNIGGTTYRIDTSTHDSVSKGKGKRTAGLIGGGAGGGALIGGLAGGGKGALIGGLIGAGAGTAGAGLTGDRDIVLSAETPLTFRLRQPIQIDQSQGPQSQSAPPQQ
jgi:hypothetical protein